jgi:signal peptidase I
MIYDIEWFLLASILLAAGISVLDYTYLRHLRANDAKLPLFVDYAKSFLPVLIVVILVRGFVYEPFRIPSGSLKPTLLVGDFIVVNKHHYGLRLPVFHYRMYKGSVPKLGDIMVFRWPPNEQVDYIKRVIGTPGDHIQYTNKILRINGTEAKQTFVGYETVLNDQAQAKKVEKREENLNGIRHFIYTQPSRFDADIDVTVPAGHYFVMGDNRDDSSDSRFWGFVPDHNIVGRADAVWMSWDYFLSSIRWRRIGRLIV